MTPLLCDRPGVLPCPQTVVYGTGRCLEHAVPCRLYLGKACRGTAFIRPLLPLPPAPRVAAYRAFAEARVKAAAFRETAANLNGPAADSRKPVQPEPVTELTDHPSSVTSPVEIETPDRWGPKAPCGQCGATVCGLGCLEFNAARLPVRGWLGRAIRRIR